MPLNDLLRSMVGNKKGWNSPENFARTIVRLAVRKFNFPTALEATAFVDGMGELLTEKELQELVAHDNGDAGWLHVAVEEYLERLPPEARAIVGLRMTGHSVAEIADRVSRAKRSVERVLQKARQELLDLRG